MAKTTGLQKIESFIRLELEKNYRSHTFTEKALPIGKKRDGTNAIHKFDAVSSDNTIVAEIKNNSWKTSGGNYPSGKDEALYKAIYFLSLVNAKTRLLILTNRECYDGFLRASDGKVMEGIEIKLYSLPENLELTAKKVHQKASKEMSPR